MPFPQFSRLLESQSLFFCAADRLEDPWEATFPEFMLDMEFWWPWLLTNNNQITTEQEARNAAVALVAQLRQLHVERGRYAVSCWHQNAQEAEPFWKLYANMQYGVAIRASVHSLEEAMPGDAAIYVADVKYIDFRTPRDDIEPEFVPAVYKRIDFAHECEVRAFCYDYHNATPFEGNGGVSVPVDLARLVSEVVVSPMAPSWFVEHVRSVVKRYAVSSIDVRSSTMYQPSQRYAPAPASVPSKERFRRGRRLVLFPDAAAFEAWRRRELAAHHYPRFGMIPGPGAINLAYGLTTEISQAIRNADPADPRVVCTVPWPHTTDGLQIVELEWARGQGWPL